MDRRYPIVIRHAVRLSGDLQRGTAAARQAARQNDQSHDLAHNARPSMALPAEGDGRVSLARGEELRQLWVDEVWAFLRQHEMTRVRDGNDPGVRQQLARPPGHDR